MTDFSPHNELTRLHGELEKSKDRASRAILRGLVLLGVVVHVWFLLDGENAIMTDDLLTNLAAGFYTAALIFWAIDYSLKKRRDLDIILNYLTLIQVHQVSYGRNLEKIRETLERIGRLTNQAANKEFFGKAQRIGVILDLVTLMLELLQRARSNMEGMKAGADALYKISIENGESELAHHAYELNQMLQVIFGEEEPIIRLMYDQVEYLTQSLEIAQASDANFDVAAAESELREIKEKLQRVRILDKYL